MESWKAHHVLKEGARTIVKSARPDLTDEELDKVLDKLFTVCAKHKENVDDLTACVYSNMRQVAKEVSGRE